MITFSSAVVTVARRKHAFTLVEMMMTVSLLSLVLATMIPTFIFFSKSVVSLGNYSSMSRDSRSGLELLSRDFHTAETLTVATNDEVTLTLPADAGGGTVNYKYTPAAAPLRGTFSRVHTPAAGASSSTQLFEDVDKFSFVYFNKLGVLLDPATSASILSEAKSVQINAKLEKKVITTTNTDYIISARFLMRNK